MERASLGLGPFALNQIMRYTNCVFKSGYYIRLHVFQLMIIMRKIAFFQRSNFLLLLAIELRWMGDLAYLPPIVLMIKNSPRFFWELCILDKLMTLEMTLVMKMWWGYCPCTRKLGIRFRPRCPPPSVDRDRKLSKTSGRCFGKEICKLYHCCH